MKFQPRFLLIPLAVAGFCFLFFQLERRPGAFANSNYLSVILVLEIVIACLWRFETVFFPVTMACFFLPATGLPFGTDAFTLRWVFLAVGALAGFSIWMRTNRVRHFALFHLVALFCVTSAIASASASAAPKIGSLKAASLFLLFLYAATGGRVAFAGREKLFVQRMVRACEILVFFVSACYLAGFNMFGNPNNLGAFIGVVATPIMLWAVLIAGDRGERQRRCLALVLCGVLLYVSVCRAAIIADTVLAVGITIALRRPRIFVRAVFAGALLFGIMAVCNPSHMGEFIDSMTGRFIFKMSGQTSGVFGSRRGPWDDTIAAVKQHPWFGTGFGTSDLGSERPEIQGSAIYTQEGTNREHGSSYLAMVEYMGMLGILPFIFIIILLLRAAARVFRWMRRTGSPYHYSVPFAMITLAGLIHAGFEDWLFASGSYLCVFFWVSAFLLIDLAAANSGERTPHAQPVRSFARAPGFQESARSV